MPATLIPQVTMPRIVSPVRSARPLRTDHYCITVSQYHRMISDGYFADDDRVELLEGQLVNKMSKKPVMTTCISPPFGSAMIRNVLLSHCPEGLGPGGNVGLDGNALVGAALIFPFETVISCLISSCAV